MSRSPVVAAILRLNGRALGRSDECAVASSMLQLADSMARSSIATQGAPQRSKTRTGRNVWKLPVVIHEPSEELCRKFGWDSEFSVCSF